MTILQSIFATDNWSFAVFLALFPLVNKTLLCGLRNYREKNSEKQDFITGSEFCFFNM